MNTIVFAIAGIKVGDLTYEYVSGLGSQETNFNVLLLGVVLVYPIILVSRGVTMTLFFPILKRLGTGCDWREAVVMWWGGLRGAVGLALALAVHHSMYDSVMWGDGQAVPTLMGSRQPWAYQPWAPRHAPPPAALWGRCRAGL